MPRLCVKKPHGPNFQLRIVYDKVKRKRSWSNCGETVQTVGKSGLVRKVSPRVWGDMQGIIYYELLPFGQTLDSDLCCHQLERLKYETAQKRTVLSNKRGIADFVLLYLTIVKLFSDPSR